MYFNCDTCKALSVPVESRPEAFRSASAAVVLVFTDTGAHVALCEVCARKWSRAQVRLSKPWPLEAQKATHN